MLHRLASTGYVRPTTDAESAEFGHGFVAVLDDHECWHQTRETADAQLHQMMERRRVTQVME